MPGTRSSVKRKLQIDDSDDCLPRPLKTRKYNQREKSRSQDSTCAELGTPSSERASPVGNFVTKCFYGTSGKSYQNPLERKNSKVLALQTDENVQKNPVVVISKLGAEIKSPVFRKKKAKKIKRSLVKCQSKEKTFSENIVPATPEKSSRNTDVSVSLAAEDNRPSPSPVSKRRFFKHRGSPVSKLKKTKPGTSVSVNRKGSFQMKFQKTKLKFSERKDRPVVAPLSNTGSSSHYSLKDRIADALNSSKCIDKPEIATKNLPESNNTKTEDHPLNPYSQDLFSDNSQEFVSSGNALEETPVVCNDEPRSNRSLKEIVETRNGDKVIPTGGEIDTERVPSEAGSYSEKSTDVPNGKKLFSIFTHSSSPVMGATPKFKGNASDKLQAKVVSCSPGQEAASTFPDLECNRKLSPKQLLKTFKDKDGREQMVLDFGQKLIGAVQCQTCGMTYTHREPTDEATHSRFHQVVINTLKFPGWKKERVVREFLDGGRILMVLPEDKHVAKKVEAVKTLVDEELGFVVTAGMVKSHTKTFLFVSTDKKIVGCCIAQSITQGYRVLADNQSQVDKSIWDRTKPWCCSTTAETAKCGISRIWVLKSYRRRNIATKLLDCVRSHFLMGRVLDKGQLAFSDPTPDGRQLAATYTGTPCFLVYKYT